MKKALKILNKLLVLSFWTFIFVSVFNKLIVIIWNFDFLSQRSWQIFHEWFITNKGVINTKSDVFLLITILLLPILWLTGCFFTTKINFLKLILTMFDKLFDNSKKFIPERIVLKNIKSEEKELEEIKNEIESFKPKKTSLASSLREELTKKISETKK